MKTKESISAIVLLSFCAAISYQAGHYPFGSLSRIGPGFFPFCLSLVLATLSIVIIVKAIFQPDEKGPVSGSLLTKAKVLRVVVIFCLMVAYGFLLSRLGFLVTTFLFTFTLFKFVEPHNWVLSTLGALAASIGNHLLFDVWLQCQFPSGWLGW